MIYFKCLHVLEELELIKRDLGEIESNNVCYMEY